ncbi:MAG: MFS transporter, partial [bacterium]|nr:MFS transporter [bacterium]
MVKSHVEESLGANPGDAALNPADSVAMGVQAARAPRMLEQPRWRAFRALRNPSFRLLFSAFLVNQTGFWISHVSLQGLMASLSSSDAAQQGRLFFAMFIPAFVLAPLAGVAADHFNRKSIVLTCYVGVAVVTSGLAITTGAALATPSVLQAFGFCLGVCFSFSGPASMALAANAVPEDDLSSAVSLQSTANNLTRVLGPAFAAPLLASGRFEVAFGVFTVAALIAALLTARMRPRPIEPEAEEGGIFSRLKNGLDHARERHPALPALITVAWVSLFGVSHVALTPIYAAEVLGDPDWFAWIVVCTGIGAMAGALTSGYKKDL